MQIRPRVGAPAPPNALRHLRRPLKILLRHCLKTILRVLPLYQRLHLCCLHLNPIPPRHPNQRRLVLLLVMNMLIPPHLKRKLPTQTNPHLMFSKRMVIHQSFALADSLQRQLHANYVKLICGDYAELAKELSLQSGPALEFPTSGAISAELRNLENFRYGECKC